MTSQIQTRLRELGITLPPPAKAIGNYVPASIDGNLVCVSQAPIRDGKVLYQGRIGAEVTLADVEACARLTAINILSALHEILDEDLDRVRQCLRLGGFLAVTQEFAEHSQVMNAASNLLIDVFGDRGRHARLTVGCMSLPGNATMILEAFFTVG